MSERHSADITSFATLDALSAAAAAEVVRLGREAVAARGRFLLALSGGSTPRRLYETLAGPAGSAMPWPATHLFWGDERHVPPAHPASNYGMARTALIEHVPVPAEHIHPAPVGSGSAAAAAAAYEDELRRTWGAAGIPVFDLVLLGMGADGHTASLFAGGPELAETERLAVAVHAPPAYDPRERITLTLPLLNAARAVLFLVAGADKQGALRSVLHGEPGNLPPAARVRPAGSLRWFVDTAAYP